MTIVPPWTTVVFLAADGEPALAPSPQRLVSGAIGEQIIGGIKMHEEIMFSSIAQNGSTVKNYEISRHQQSDSVGNRLNINRPQGKVWSLIMPIEGKSPKLSDVFAELSRLKLEYETLFYAACRVNL
ncbi:hypothetical protein KO534_05495 [Paraglaciecola arctica]|nr:hypothetical protein [Paraglaciecola arctica]MBU3002791.1 hypothetical protein [Paraglaciecola arctica]